ncbi:MAG: SGNH/GDSL hydrolase family protein [Actinomycetota bacterium]|nr:SGNH/GDSL hydrolase family protein [Actinomycetota bacterium]MDP2287999.1 SGNH/GDSL hydrolase family protein [Actinomycetota bacterium]
MTTIVALGDSISFGVGDVRGAGVGPGWSGRLATAIGSAHHQRLAWPGARLSEMAKSQVGATVIAKPDIALVSIGGNDAICRGFDATQFSTELRKSLSTLQAAASSVVVATLPDISRTCQIPRVLRPHLRQRIELLNCAIVQAAHDSEVCILDRWNDEGAYLARHLASDRVHPSPCGYQALAEQTAVLLGIPVIGAAKQPSVEQARPGWWLAAHGVPWALKRSARLLPTVVSMLRHDSASGFSR